MSSGDRSLIDQNQCTFLTLTVAAALAGRVSSGDPHAASVPAPRAPTPSGLPKHSRPAPGSAGRAGRADEPAGGCGGGCGLWGERGRTGGPGRGVPARPDGAPAECSCSGAGPGGPQAGVRRPPRVPACWGAAALESLGNRARSLIFSMARGLQPCAGLFELVCSSALESLGNRPGGGPHHAV